MSFLFPTYYYKSAYSIPYEELAKSDKKAVIYDLDNTLVEHGAPANDQVYKLMELLRQNGYKVCFLSNNKEPRVKSFNEKIGFDYIYKAGKPKPEGYLKALSKMGVTADQTIFVGDQIFTDIIGANLSKIDSYLVKKIGPKEEIQIHIKRIPEKPIIGLFRLFHSKKCHL